MRKTKIICTIGPASQNLETIKEMIEAGMNVCRCNFSHGSYEEQKTKMMNVVRISEEMGKPVATLIDTKGPEIRIRTFENERVTLEEGQSIAISSQVPHGSQLAGSVSLSSKGTANCYIVSKSGTYGFPTVKGNSSQSVGAVARASVKFFTVSAVNPAVSFVAYSAVVALSLL